MSVPARVAALTAAFLLVVGLVVFVAFYYVGSATTQLPTIHYAASGGQVSVTLQEDPQNDSNTRPDWVTYYTQDPDSKQWVHTTLFSVPANTKVNVTIYGYDGCTPLRNNYFSQVQGVTGNAIAVQQFDKNNKPLGGVKNRVGGQLLGGLQRGPYLRHPGAGRVRPGRLAEREQLRQQPVRHVAVHADLRRRVRGGDLQLHVPGPDRRLPVAVPHPVRRRVPRRQRRPHADSRMDDRLHVRGGLMSSAAEVPGQTPTDQTPPGQAPPDQAAAEPPHGWRMFMIWIVLALAADLVIWFVWYPHLPPGRMSDAARHQQFDIAVLAISAAPVILAVFIYFIYSIVVWRVRPGDEEDGPPIYGNTKVQASWIIGTTAIVLWLAVFGTIELVGPAGAGAGEGPSPIWTLAGKQASTWTPGTNTMLQVQVIGQQWVWTYRYPQFGGMESTQLYLPVDTPVTFHVTSLDVIHSFWAYQLGVKADANPGVDNVAYVTAKQAGAVTVRCNELCGVWHGAMTTSGQVVSQTAFQAWASGVQGKEQGSGLLAALPPYALVYDPTVIPQLGANMTKVVGVTGAAGYYYGPGNPVTP